MNTQPTGEIRPKSAQIPPAISVYPDFLTAKPHRANRASVRKSPVVKLNYQKPVQATEGGL
jgi:hypothetical protein